MKKYYTQSGKFFAKSWILKNTDVMSVAKITHITAVHETNDSIVINADEI